MSDDSADYEHCPQYNQRLSGLSDGATAPYEVCRTYPLEPGRGIVFRNVSTGRLMAIDGGASVCTDRAVRRFWVPVRHGVTPCGFDIEHYRVGSGVPDRDGFWAMHRDDLRQYWRPVSDPTIDMRADHIQQCPRCQEILTED